MRLTSSIWVSALVRTVFADGGFAAIERHGAESAGAIYIAVRARDGTATLYAPAPQAGYGEAAAGERLFIASLSDADQDEIAAAIAKEIRFDPDVWLVEIEPARLMPADLFSIVTP